ncbi:Phage portal protein, SPP1 Gp6-like protein [Sedimentisphaera cyanobacteriorum]|uniref:Phage portal protein, SPP1 Gp6-like protein n=1 Tax=Sedimentisphaera cyanobacteriorum TaxID=1940790 RepID=A0A1Q2HQQ1_9BACT|nr:phage portal protein [Sedimentisphaera cyanobacteriorum]AQQ09778.1 Phage portal protein, SPP1 Gp6-like protein [Sedimentisphaera cyanobacteriorum]
MEFDFSKLGFRLDEGFVRWLIEKYQPARAREFRKLYEYYSNCRYNCSAGQMQQAQIQGLPERIRGSAEKGIGRKEVVIENDIGWRINSMNDFLFGRQIRIKSLSKTRDKARKIESLLNEVFEANGGSEFFMSLALLGSVYGFVDILLRIEGLFSENAEARDVKLDLVPAERALPVLEEGDAGRINCYLQNFRMEINQAGDSGIGGLSRKQIQVTELFSPELFQRFHDGRLVSELPCRIPELPVVHIQNISRPQSYEGASDVAPLIPLQDELNTRLSDRAFRVTMQSFKLYLAKGLEDPGAKEVVPGRIWYTWNQDASIEQFGGDSACPGEESHIDQIRAAMDKISGVTPLAAGVLRGKIGNLSSAVALKMTLIGILSKNERRKAAYGDGIRQLCRKLLLALDSAGIFKTSREERKVEVVFADPLPENTTDKLNEAILKKEAGLPEEEVFSEFGAYPKEETG